MPQKTTGISRRKTVTILASATVAGAILPPWPEAVAGVADIVAPTVPPLSAAAANEGLSALFRGREVWMRRYWTIYQQSTDGECPESVTDWRRMLHGKYGNYVRLVPETAQDREFLRRVFANLEVFAADHPKVPWDESTAADLAIWLDWGKAGSISRDHPDAITL